MKSVKVNVGLALGSIIAGLLFAFELQARLLDDFEDGTMYRWSTFVYGEGNVEEQMGVLELTMARGLEQPAMASAVYMEEPLEIQPGEWLDLRIDLTERLRGDSIAVVGWMPSAHWLQSYSGYFMGLSADKVWVGKGANQYFVEDEVQPQMEFSAVRLVLGLRREGETMKVRGRVLDFQNDEAVMWEETVVDAVGADDVGETGEFPVRPFEGAGHLMVALVVKGGVDSPVNHGLKFNEAGVSAPASDKNLPPFIIPTSPRPGENFFAPTTSDEVTIAYTIRDEDPVQMVGMVPGTLLGTFDPNPDESGGEFTNIIRYEENRSKWTVPVQAFDGAGGSNTVYVSIDTFRPDLPVIEAEDYDYEGGGYLLNPAPGQYQGKDGLPGTDYHDTQEPGSASIYRPNDGVATVRSFDYVHPKYLEEFRPELGIYDYVVREIQQDEFRQYTRRFEEERYEIYLRQSLIGVNASEAVLERVETGPDQEITTHRLGRFRGWNSGFQFENVPLTDEEGEVSRITLSGEQTLRLRQVSPVPEGGDIAQNYLVLLPKPLPELVLETATEVGGPYAPEPSALYEGERIRADVPDEPVRFYRLNASQEMIIEEVTVSDTGLTFEVRSE